MKRLLALLSALVAVATGAAAHEVRPAYLELRQTRPDTYDVLWKVPGQGENLRLGIYVQLPKGCANLTAPRGSAGNNAYSERSTIRCPGGLSGRTLHIAGLSVTMTDVLVRLERLDGTTQVTRMTPSDPSFVVQARPEPAEIAGTYLVMGIEHILTGPDHLLFVLGLLLIVGRRWGMMLKTVTAFTVAHSITLAAAALGYVHAPLVPVDAAIALSILFLGPEIVRVWRGQTSFTIRHTWVVAFVFGLLHGLGFASVLTSAGLPRSDLPFALLSFNVGVEIGQLAFLGLVLVLEQFARALRIDRWSWARMAPGYAVGTLGAAWTIQRLAILLSGAQ